MKRLKLNSETLGRLEARLASTASLSEAASMFREAWMEAGLQAFEAYVQGDIDVPAPGPGIAALSDSTEGIGK